MPNPCEIVLESLNLDGTATVIDCSSLMTIVQTYMQRSVLLYMQKFLLFKMEQLSI